MKICGISDIHGNLYNAVPECDVLCICGDIIPLNIQRQNDASATWWSNRFANWVNGLPCKKVLVVPGNHDFYLEKIYNDGAEARELFKDSMRNLTDNKVEILIDELYEYKGITFYGTPWIEPIQFQEGRWAFERPKKENKEDKYIYDNIQYCDILLTHDNPNYNKVLDYYSYGRYKYHLFGHWHNGISYEHLGQRNCSILDDRYNFKKELQIVTIDVMTEKDKVEIEQDFLTMLVNNAPSEEVLSFLKQFSIPTSVKEDRIKWIDYEDYIIDTNVSDNYITDSNLKEAA